MWFWEILRFHSFQWIAHFFQLFKSALPGDEWTIELNFVCEFLNFSPLDDTLSKSSQTNANDDDDMPRSVGESNSEEYTEVDSESGSDVDDEDPSIIKRHVISEQSGN